MSDFDDIRAYQDHEVNAILSSLLYDTDFLNFVSMELHPKISRFIPYFVHRKIRNSLKAKFEDIHNIDAWQSIIAPYVELLIKQTTENFIVRGIENLDKDKHYLFISNHRDIAMDPMLINYALLTSGMNTSKVAIGDNLIERPFVGKLMRLNKSFIVKRSITARKEKLEAAQKLSNYVHESHKQSNNIWIAQKEGRAKDNKDRTDTAILKMLHLAGRKLGWEFKDSMNFLNIVPVSISYEWDPCDIDKAKELTFDISDQVYKKSKDEDFQTIIKGMKGNKGKVSIHFSKPVSLDSNVAEDWTKKIDQCIFNGYELFDSNLIAKGLLDDSVTSVVVDSKRWNKRFSKVDSKIYAQIIKSYAQPVIAKKQCSEEE